MDFLIFFYFDLNFKRRLRHLKCIIGRNIDPNLVPASRSTKTSLLMLYFSIHDSKDLSTGLNFFFDLFG